MSSNIDDDLEVIDLSPDYSHAPNYVKILFYNLIGIIIACIFAYVKLHFLQ